MKTPLGFNSVFTLSNRSFSSNNGGSAAPASETEAKVAAAQFMKKVDDLQIIDEVKSYDDWKPKVMSQQIPVIVDCYADWCQPCKKLTPVLENLTLKYEGKFKLVKLNIDNLP